MKSAHKRMTDRLDKLCLIIVRLTTGGKCQRCGKSVTGSNSHPAHVIAKGSGASWRRFDMLNIMHLCLPCHMWWHNNPLESSMWFRELWPHLDKYLEKYKGGKPAKITKAEMEQLIIDYKLKIKELRGE